MPRRRVCFVTGTRAEYGLMRSTLKAIRAHPRLQLQLIATGTHLSHAHGRTVDEIGRDGFAVDAAVAWPGRDGLAGDTMAAGQRVADVLRRLNPHVVLVVGDRVEAFAAAAAAHLNGQIVAHVHGGDRALGQCDDTLRHAITKLSHLHFAATRRSAERIYKLGERRDAIHLVGTPGVDDVAPVLAGRQWGGGFPPYAVAVLHPERASDIAAARQARTLLAALRDAGVPRIVLIDPNNDPGWRGIVRVYDRLQMCPAIERYQNLSRDAFLRWVRSSQLLVGNSSSGIIEAASLGVRVVNVGSRQQGRERSANVSDVPWDESAIVAAIRANFGKPFRGKNVYGGGGVGKKIAAALSAVRIDDALRQKLIRY